MGEQGKGAGVEESEQNFVGDRSNRLAWIWKGWMGRWTDRFLGSNKS